MDTIFMNSKNSKTTDPHILLLNLTDKINLQRSDKYVAYLSQHLLYMENIKKSCKINNFKKSAPRWNEDFELPDGSYYVSDIQDLFEYMLKTWRKDC